MTPGLLSVILPNYNHATVVADQLRAILTQSYRNFEFIIIDDKSTDNSVEVIESVIAGDSRVKFIKNEKNQGVLKAVDDGRRLAQGEFIGFYASDDRLLPGFFEKSMSALSQAPQAGLATSVTAVFDASMQVRMDQGVWTDRPTYFNPDQLCDVICGGFVGCHNSIFRRSVWEECFPPGDGYQRLKWHGDWFHTLTIAFRHGICYIPEILAALRIDPNSYSGAKMYDPEHQVDVVWTIIELLKSDAYRDVLPYFARGGVMATPAHVVRTVMAKPERWDPITMMLIQRPLLDWNLHAAQVQSQRRQRAQGNG